MALPHVTVALTRYMLRRDSYVGLRHSIAFSDGFLDFSVEIQAASFRGFLREACGVTLEQLQAF